MEKKTQNKWFVGYFTGKKSIAVKPTYSSMGDRDSGGGKKPKIHQGRPESTWLLKSSKAQGESGQGGDDVLISVGSKVQHCGQFPSIAELEAIKEVLIDAHGRNYIELP